MTSASSPTPVQYLATALSVAAMVIGATEGANADVIYNQSTGNGANRLTPQQKACATAAFDDKIFNDLNSANAQTQAAARQQVVACMNSFNTKLLTAATFSPQKPTACVFHAVGLFPADAQIKSYQTLPAMPLVDEQKFWHLRFPCVSGRNAKNPLSQLIATIDEIYLTPQTAQEKHAFLNDGFGRNLPVWQEYPFYYPAFFEFTRDERNEATGFHGFPEGRLGARGGSADCFRQKPSDTMKVLDLFYQVRKHWDLKASFYEDVPFFVIYNGPASQRGKETSESPELQHLLAAAETHKNNTR
jgi:hypothetical protein